jgi:putative nucleotidyltransferase with HDIG domain
VDTDSLEAPMQSLERFAQALEARDPLTASHSLRVSELAVALGKRIGVRGRHLDKLAKAGLLHDLGKIGLRDAILYKVSPFTPQEWQAMRRHSEIGADLIAKSGPFADIATMVRHHHERWNGSGYPAGLSAQAIPLGARILAVAEAYDVITRARHGPAPKVTPAEAVPDITKRSGTWYDPDVVNALRQLHGLDQPPREGTT